MNFWKRLVRLWQLSEQYDKNRSSDISLVKGYLNDFQAQLNEHTVVHADIHYKQPSQVIVIGRYRNNDYVRVFNLEHNGFEDLVDKLREMERNAEVGRFDLPSHAFPFSAVYKKDRF